MVAYAKDSKGNQNSVSETKQNQQVEDNLEQANNADQKALPDSTNETKENENIQEDNTTNTVTKIEGKRKEFLERLDNIQKELDTLYFIDNSNIKR